MLPVDDLAAASAQEALCPDKRVFHYWDDKRTLGQLVSKILQLSTPIAWDIYLLYSPGTSLERETIPTPNFWMHQLDERSDLLLDPERLMSVVQKSINAIS
jgi:hypothetical protein